MMSADITINYRGEATVNKYNQQVDGEPVPVQVKGYFRPRRSNTIVTGGESLQSDASIIVYPDVSPDGIASVVVGGVQYSVDGEAMRHWNPAKGRVEYLRIDLRRGVN